MAVSLTKKSLNKQETKDRILLAAKAEFAQKGFAGARMEAIAKKAKANKAMLHYYFGSKKNLYTIVLKKIFFARAEKPVPIDFDQWNISAAQKLYLIIFHLVNVHCEVVDPEFHQIMAWEVAEGRKVLKSFAKEYFIPRIKKVESVIEEGIAAGDFATDYPMLVVWDLISFFVGYGMHRDTYSGTEIEEQLYTNITKEKMLDFMLHHIFKSLSTKHPVKIPQLPQEIKEELTQLVKAEFNRGSE